MSLITVDYGDVGGGEVTALRTDSRVNLPNKKNTRTFDIPSGVTKCFIYFFQGGTGSFVTPTISGSIIQTTENSLLISYASFSSNVNTGVNRYELTLSGQAGTITCSSTAGSESDFDCVY